MLKENLKDAGEIIQTIITQPLSIAGVAGEISLLKAVQAFKTEDAVSSELSKVLHAFLDYPDPTRALITELELIAADLKN